MGCAGHVLAHIKQRCNCIHSIHCYCTQHHMSQSSDASLNHDGHCDCDDCDENTWECTKCYDVFRLDLDEMRPIQIWEVTYCTDCVAAFYKNLGRTLCVMMYGANTDKDIADHLECEKDDATFDARIVATLLKNNSWSLDDLKHRITKLKPPKRKRDEKDDDDDDANSTSVERKKQRTK